jgi:hypothetical protein
MHGKGRLRPAEIDNMTMAEVCLWLDEPQEDEVRPPENVASGHENVMAYVEWYRSLTPEEKLAAAIEGRL